MIQEATSPVTLDSVIQSLDRLIQKGNPERIKIITQYMQRMIPADDAEVVLRAGGDDEESNLTFFVDKVENREVLVPFVELLRLLLRKTPMDEVEHLGHVLRLLESTAAPHYDWDMTEPYFSKGASNYVGYLYIKSTSRGNEAVRS